MLITPITTTTTNSDQVRKRHLNILWISKGTGNLSDTIYNQTLFGHEKLKYNILDQECYN